MEGSEPAGELESSEQPLSQQRILNPLARTPAVKVDKVEVRKQGKNLMILRSRNTNR